MVDKKTDYRGLRERFDHDIPCVKCNHIGIVRVQIGNIGTLVRCSCKYGNRQIWDLPVLSNEMKSLPLPYEQFKPPFEPKSQVQAVRFIREKISWFVEKIRLAEEFWKSQKTTTQKENL